MSDLKAYSVKEAALLRQDPSLAHLRCHSIDSLAEMWGCPPHHVEILWERGELPGLMLGSHLKRHRRSSLRFREIAVAPLRHLAFGDFPPAPSPKPPKAPKTPKPARELPELAKAILECAKTKPAYYPVREPWKVHRIYFVQCGDYVKIGYATNVKERMNGLRGMTPYALTLLKVIPGMIAGERAIHAHLAHYRHAYEWFRLEPELAAAIRALPGKGKR